MKQIDKKFIETVEKSHFRTNEDTGATQHAIFIWNLVREHCGLDRLDKEDLPAWCVAHKKYHKIDESYGCKRKTSEN